MRFWYEDIYGKDKKALPTMIGCCFFSVPTIHVHDPALLEEIYVKQNKYYTKHQSLTLKAKPLI